MERFKFVLYRPLQMIPVLFGVSVITFILVQMIPGDPVRIMLGSRASAEVLGASVGGGGALTGLVPSPAQPMSRVPTRMPGMRRMCELPVRVGGETPCSPRC